MGSATIILSVLAAVLIISSVDAGPSHPCAPCMLRTQAPEAQGRHEASLSFAGTGSCPLPSKIYSCSPKCVQTYDCSHGKVCCPNSCNTKSCVDLATFGNTNNDKYSQSGGTGVYCNNEKCRPSEVCKMDPATRRMKCMRA